MPRVEPVGDDVAWVARRLDANTASHEIVGPAREDRLRRSRMILRPRGGPRRGCRRHGPQRLPAAMTFPAELSPCQRHTAVRRGRIRRRARLPCAGMASGATRHRARHPPGHQIVTAAIRERAAAHRTDRRDASTTYQFPCGRASARSGRALSPSGSPAASPESSELDAGMATDRRRAGRLSILYASAAVDSVGRGGADPGYRAEGSTGSARVARRRGASQVVRLRETPTPRRAP